MSRTLFFMLNWHDLFKSFDDTWQSTVIIVIAGNMPFFNLPYSLREEKMRDASEWGTVFIALSLLILIWAIECLFLIVWDLLFIKEKEAC